MKNRFLFALGAALVCLAQPAKAEDVNPNLAKLKEIQAQMAAQGIEIKLPPMEEAPPDSYAGEDKDMVKQMAREAWEKNFPEEEIVDIRIQMDGWDRYQDKRWSDGDESWYNVDYSEIQALVFVKKDEQLATMYPVNITKDHMNNEKLEVDATSNRETGLLQQDIAMDMLKD